MRTTIECRQYTHYSLTKRQEFHNKTAFYLWFNKKIVEIPVIEQFLKFKMKKVLFCEIFINILNYLLNRILFIYLNNRLKNISNLIKWRMDYYFYFSIFKMNEFFQKIPNFWEIFLCVVSKQFCLISLINLIKKT